jgi:hypothetical protein
MRNIVGTLIVLGCLFASADVSLAQRDICGCANAPDLGDFDAGSPATYPPGAVRVQHGNGLQTITIPLPASGVFVFNSFNGRHVTAPGCCSAGTSIRFVRNAANTPVTILVKGDFTVDTSVDMSVHGDKGTDGTAGVNGFGGLGGPGGFRGGDGAYQFVNLAADGGTGFGPGGGAPGTGSPLTAGQPGTFIGVPELLPLVGGSGGGGGASSTANSSCSGGGGGGGGGALLVAANGTIRINGFIGADGGNFSGGGSSSCASSGLAGSGGAIRLVADTIAATTSGSDVVTARGGFLSCCTRAAKPGRIRLEAFTNNLQGDRTDPPASRAMAPGPITPPFPQTVKITSVGGQAVPATPQGTYGVTDIILAVPGVVQVNVQSEGIPGGTTVQITVKPRVGGAGVSQSPLLASCNVAGVCTSSASFDLPPGEYVLEAKATFQTS